MVATHASMYDDEPHRRQRGHRATVFVFAACVLGTDAIKIGALWPSSDTDLTTAAQAAVTLFKQTKAPPVNIEVVTRTDAGTSSEATYGALCGYLTQGGYTGFLGPPSAHVPFAAHSASLHGMPLVSTASPDGLPAEKEAGLYDSFRRLSPTSAAEMDAIIAFLSLPAFKELRTAVLLAGGPSSKVFSVQLSNAGVSVILTHDGMASAGTLPFFEKLEAQLIQAIVVVGTGAEAKAWVVAALAHPTAFRLGRLWLLGEEGHRGITTDVQGRLEGLLAVRQQNDRVGLHADMLQAKFSTPYTPAAARTYDATWLLLEASLNTSAYQTPSVASTCTLASAKWAPGARVLQAMDGARYTGASGRVDVSKGAGHHYELVNLVSEKWAAVARFETTAAAAVETANITWRGGQAPSSTDLMAGRHLKILFIEFKPFVFKNDVTGLYEGLVVDLIDELAKTLKFTYTQTVWKGGWEKGVHAVKRGEFDMQAADTGITRAREAVVDFTQPYMETTSILMLGRPKDDLSMWRFLEPFSVGVWCALIGTVFASSFVFWALEGGCLAKPLADREYGETYVPEGKHGVQNSIWFVCTAMLQLQGSEPITKAGRVMGFGLYWLAVITIATYTAELAAYLSTKPGVYPVESIQQVQDGKVSLNKIGIMPDTVNAQWVEKAIGKSYLPLTDDGDAATLNGLVVATVQDSIWAEFFTQQTYKPSEAVCPNPGAASTARGFAVLSEDTHTSRATHIKLREAITQGAVSVGAGVARGQKNALWDSPCEAAGKCAFELRGLGWNPRGVGLPLPKDSPYLKPLSQEILRLRESGFIEEMRRKWFSGECTGKGSVESDGAMGVDAFSGTLVLCGGLWVLAFLIRIIRLVFLRHRTKAPSTDGGAEMQELKTPLEATFSNANDTVTSALEGYTVQEPLRTFPQVQEPLRTVPQMPMAYTPTVRAGGSGQPPLSPAPTSTPTTRSLHDGAGGGSAGPNDGVLEKPPPPAGRMPLVPLSHPVQLGFVPAQAPVRRNTSESVLARTTGHYPVEV